MKIQSFVTGPFGVNIYIVYKNNECVVIDPAYQCKNAIDFIEQNKLNVNCTMLTHGHVDHFAGLPEIKDHFKNSKSFISKIDLELAAHSSLQSRMFGHPDVGKVNISSTFEDSDIFRSGSFEFKLIHVPGHSSGSLCFYIGDILFSGDTLFKQSIGRSDLFEGNHNLLVDSIKSKLLCLPDDTIVYPGHGPSTTILSEKTNNPYL